VRTEDKNQKTLVAWLEAVVPNVLVFAIPNAARRTAGGRAGNAVPGLKAGMPDICFLYDGRPYFVEVKTTTGRLSKTQVECHRELRKLGFEVAVASSIEELREAVACWGIHTREAAHV